MLCKLATALSKWKAAPFLGLSQTRPDCPALQPPNAFVLSIISASMHHGEVGTFFTDKDGVIAMVNAHVAVGFFSSKLSYVHPTFNTVSWGQLWYSCSVGQGWVLGNCQNRRNCDVPGFAGVEPAGSMRQQVKHRLRTQSRPNPHLLLQLTNPDMSHFTCTDSLHP